MERGHNLIVEHQLHVIKNGLILKLIVTDMPILKSSLYFFCMCFTIGISKDAQKVSPGCTLQTFTGQPIIDDLVKALVRIFHLSLFDGHTLVVLNVKKYG